MGDYEQRHPEPYEPGVPTTREDDEESLAAPPTKEQLAERNKRFSRPRKPMGPAPKDDRRRSDEEHGPSAEVPPTPAPEPPEATEAGRREPEHMNR